MDRREEMLRIRWMISRLIALISGELALTKYQSDYRFLHNGEAVLPGCTRAISYPSTSAQPLTQCVLTRSLCVVAMQSSMGEAVLQVRQSCGSQYWL